MPTPSVIAVAAIAAILYLGGSAAWHGAKKAGHAIVRVMKHGVHPHK